MPYLICFLILFGQVALGKESGEITKTNRIRKGNLNPMHQNAFGEESQKGKSMMNRLKPIIVKKMKK